MMRRRLLAGLVLWAVLSLAGVGVIALPDDGPRVISLSEGHGPWALETVGVALLLGGWLVFVRGLWSTRTGIRHRLLLWVLVMIGVLLVIWSVGTDSGAWWTLGVTILVLVQVSAALSALRDSANV